MKLSFTQRLTLNFCLILAVFSIGIIFFEQHQERKFKTEALEEKLDSYTEITYKYLNRLGENDFQMDSLLYFFPANLRLTLISSDGKVLYDNRLDSFSQVDNHANRPEIIAASKNGSGSDIRRSSSTQKEYLYYAKHLGNNYIRTALPYNIQVQRFLKPDNAFLYYLIGLFLLGFVFIRYISGRFGKTIQQLRDFSSAAKHKLPVVLPNFPNDEIGEVGRQIAEDYRQLKESEIQLALEHEKLLMHVQSSAEGICFFMPNAKVAFYNGLFLQYMNLLSDTIVTDPAEMLQDDIFAEVRHFLSNRDEKTYFEMPVNRQGKHFTLRVNVFEDNSFELVLNDTTKEEKNKRLKQEMTGNIAHELRTPVTGIRGYLETILDNQLEKEKEREFVVKAYEQIITLSDLIRDMSLLSKINEAPGTFQFKSVHLQTVIEKVQFDLQDALQAKDIIVHSTVPADFTVWGNENLLYSIFRNLMDNVINHAGESVTVTIRQYSQEGQMAHFSFSDNGAGIADEKHLARLFERFYRVSEGRTRDTGGSGLGLAIVKNAIVFHSGTITVKNRAGGGLEFLFSLPVG
ncbi:two-component sensor histidine kinase [Bacteroidia bacterium]|nr:two-component sensor histidine kinase [Bacteroidia bacterium]